jgi:putative membrane protein
MKTPSSVVIAIATTLSVFATAPVSAKQTPETKTAPATAPRSAGAAMKPDFVQTAADAGTKEVNAAKVALQHASNAEVKSFATRMEADHAQANKELTTAATRKGRKVTPNVAEAQPALDQMSKLSGAAFDRAYMDEQVADHEKAVALFKDESMTGTDADFKKWAGDKLPTLEAHLKMAREIRAKLAN